MRMLRNSVLAAVAAGTMVLPAVAADAPVKLSVIGTWSSLTNYQKHEAPFWRGLPKATKGQFISTIGSYSEFGLKGFEVMRLLKSGVFDYAHGLPGYVAAENAIFEGGDLSAVVQDINVERKVAEAYRPTLEKAFEEIYGAKLLQLYPFPSQMLWCKTPVASLADLKGKKIRVYSTTLGDFVEGAGGTSVTVPFGEVIPALEKGVVDCGITGTMSAYTAKWYQAAKYAYTLRVGWGLAFGAMNLKKWNSMTSAQQTDLKTRLDNLTDAMWAETAKEDDIAIKCLTSTSCPRGEGAPVGGMKLVTPTDADLKLRDTIAKDVILARWAKRCGVECAANWNKTVGKVIGLKAVAK